MSNFCAIDFGTSNSTIGIKKTGKLKLIKLNGNSSNLPSAIFMKNKEFVFGQDAINNYLFGEDGRFMKSFKNILGTDLMDYKIRFGVGFFPIVDVIGKYLNKLKIIAEKELGASIENVLLGRPIHFNDKNSFLDNLAEDVLRSQALKADFKRVEFQYEPVAAALTYKNIVDNSEVALIVDIGGGTADFSLLILNKNNVFSEKNIICSGGIHIGGTNFDKSISFNKVSFEMGRASESKYEGVLAIGNSIYSDISSWEKVRFAYNYKNINYIKERMLFVNDSSKFERLLKVISEETAHDILIEIEKSKILLSENDICNMDFSFVEEGFKVCLKKEEMEGLILSDVMKIVLKASEVVEKSNFKNDSVDKLILTGGSSKIPLLQKELKNTFKNAELIETSTFESVGMGLLIDAEKRFS